MKDRFCVNKTLFYLTILIVLMIGGFYFINYLNSQRITSDSEAATREPNTAIKKLINKFLKITPTPTKERYHSCGVGRKGYYYSEAADPRAGFGERGFEWALFEGTANDYNHQRISGYYIGNDGCYYPIGTPASEKNK